MPQKIISAQRKTAREEEKNKGITKHPENKKIALESLYLLIINLHINGLHF